MACNHIWLQSQCRALPQVQRRLCWCQAQGWGERQHQKKMKAILFCSHTPPWAVRRQSWLLLINSLEICGRGVQERSPSRGQGGVPPEKPWGGPWSLGRDIWGDSSGTCCLSAVLQLVLQQNVWDEPWELPKMQQVQSSAPGERSSAASGERWGWE